MQHIVHEPEFHCPECEFDFRTIWSPGQEIDCPCCNTIFETDYDLSDEFGITNIRLIPRPELL